MPPPRYITQREQREKIERRAIGAGKKPPVWSTAPLPALPALPASATRVARRAVKTPIPPVVRPAPPSAVSPYDPLGTLYPGWELDPVTRKPTKKIGAVASPIAPPKPATPGTFSPTPLPKTSFYDAMGNLLPGVRRRPDGTLYWPDWT